MEPGEIERYSERMRFMENIRSEYTESLGLSGDIRKEAQTAQTIDGKRTVRQIFVSTGAIPNLRTERRWKRSRFNADASGANACVRDPHYRATRPDDRGARECRGLGVLTRVHSSGAAASGLNAGVGQRDHLQFSGDGEGKPAASCQLPDVSVRTTA